MHESRTDRPPRGLVLACVAASLPMFMAALDNLVMTFALPVIKQELGASVEQLQWFVNAYSIAFATLMLPLAALGDRLGRRMVFFAGVTVFTAASALAATASTAEILIVARAVQGVGAAAIVPLSLTIVSAAATPKVRPIAIGVWGGVNGLGIAVGPIIGGAVVEGFAWPGIFWLNVPIGLLTLALIPLAVPASWGRRLPFDTLGSLLAVVFVLPLIWAIVEGEDRGWSSAAIVGAFAVAAAALGAFVWHEHRSPAAFLPLSFFRERPFTLANIAGLLFSAGVFGAIFLLSQYLQVGMGYGALEAGLRAAPWTFAPMVAAPLSGFIVRRTGPGPVIVTGLALQTAAITWIVLVSDTGTTYGQVVAPMLLAGIGMGLTLAPLATAVLIGRTEVEHGIAASVNSTVRQLGVAIGIALVTAVFLRNGDYLPGRPFVDGMKPALIACAAITGAATVAALGLGHRIPSTNAPTRTPVAASATSLEN